MTGTLAHAERASKKRTQRPQRRSAPLNDNPLLSSGRPLATSVRRGLERHLGHDLADIRIHDDEEAAQLTDAAGAEAFVLGSHVYFGAGRFDVSSEPGRRLLAHEAAHVVQNRRSGLALDDLVPCHEADADHSAARDWLPDKLIAERPAPADGQVGAVELPQLQLPALRYSGGAATGSKGTVKVADLVLRMISRTLRLDPEDRGGRVRAQLARLAPDVREQVIDLARTTLSASDYTRLDAVLDKAAPAAAISTPVVGADPDDVAEAESAATQPEPGHTRVEQAPHTHGDGTAHTHGDGTAHTHTEDGAKRGGLLAGIIGFLFGGPLLGRSAPAGDAKTTASKSVPTESAPAPAEKTEEAAAPQVTDDQEQLAEGKPKPIALADAESEAPAEGATAEPAEPGSAPGSPDPRVSEPEAAKNEVAAGASGGSGGAPAAAEQVNAEEPAAQDKTADAEDRTVLESHGHDMEAKESSPAAPDEAAGPEAAQAEPEPGADAPEAAEPEAAAAPEVVEPEVAAPEAGASETAMPDEGASGAGAAEPSAAETTGAASEPAAPEPAAPEADTPEVDTPEVAATEDVPEAAAPEGEAETAPPEAQPDEAGPEGQGAEGSGGNALAACASGGAEAQKPPEPEADAPSGACGGGGSAAGGDKAEAPAAPDVSASTPDAALATVSALPATDMQTALPQVGTAATTDVSKKREAMPPPTMDRPSGAAAGLDVSAPIPQRAVTPYTGPAKPDKVDTPAGVPTPDPDLAPVPSPSAKQVTVGAPRLGGDQKLTEADAAKVAESIDEVPVTDPELTVDAGDPGAVALEADADPTLVSKQKRALDGQIGDVAAQGAKDAAAPLGEADIRPHVPPKTLTASPDQGASCPGLDSAKGKGPGAASSKYPKVAVDAIVAEKSKGDIQAGVAKAGTDFQSARDKRDADSEQAQADAKQKMDGAVTESNDEQVTLRRDAIRTSTTLRGQWTEEQHQAVDEAVGKSDTASQAATTDIGNHKRKADTAARTHIDNGNREIKTARQDAEAKAREKKAAAKKEKSGILGWIGSKVASFFDALKSAITGFFDIARKLVRKAIDGAKKLAHEAIELGRKAVVGAIKVAGDVIIAAGDVVLAAFPETRAKFREKVTEVVDTATTKVNEAADALERGIQALLDGLATALDCALQYLQAGYLAAVDVLASVVKAALDAAQQFLDMLAEWAAIIADVAGNPIGWLKNLGRAAIDGVRNCLWGALKRAVKQWFNDKVEEVIGVGKMILNILLKGCLKFADIARMAWDAIKAALPGILIQLIIEKLVSLLIPAGAALLLIIDGLKAAWGAASRILAAFQKFMAFLKAVKSGSAAGAFADLIAAAGIAVVDFISNFLIGRLKGAGKGVGGTLKAMAARIGKVLGKVGRTVGRAARAVGRGLVRGAKAGAGLVKSGAAAVVRGGKRAVAAVARGVRRVGAMVPRGLARGARAVGRAVDPRRLARAIARSRLGQAVGRGIRKGKDFAKDKWAKTKEKFKQWREKRKKAKKTPEERLEIAYSAIAPSLQSLIGRGISLVRLLVKRAYWYARYRAKIVVADSGSDSTFTIAVNPKRVGAKAYKLTGGDLLAALDEAAKRLLARTDVQGAAKSMIASTKAGKQAKVGAGAAGFPATVAAMRSPDMAHPERGKSQIWSVGSGAHDVREWRPAGNLPGERMVQHIKGPYTPEQAHQQALDKWLSEAGGKRGDAASARAMQSFVQTGAVPKSVAGKERDFARTSMLIFGRESGGRSLRNVALAPMTVDLVAKGKLTWREALNRPGYWRRPKLGELPDTRTGGAFPMSFYGAGAAAAFREGSPELREAMTGRHDPSKSAGEIAKRESALNEGVAELEKRELALARKWLAAQSTAEGGMRFRDRQHAFDWVYQRLLKLYGIAHKADKAARR